MTHGVLVPIQGGHQKSAIAFFTLRALPSKLLSPIPWPLGPICLNVSFHCVIVPRAPILIPLNGTIFLSRGSDEKNSSDNPCLPAFSPILAAIVRRIQPGVRFSDSVSPLRDARDAGGLPNARGWSPQSAGIHVPHLRSLFEQVLRSQRMCHHAPSEISSRPLHMLLIGPG